MIAFNEWLEKQQADYKAGFRERESLLLAEGTKSGIHPRKVGYTLIYRHSKEIALGLAKISARIAGCMPCVSYPFDSIHICALDQDDAYKKTIGDEENDLAYLDKEFGKRLCNAVREVAGEKASLSIRLNALLFNPEAAIVEGITEDSSVYDFSLLLLEACKKEGINSMDKFPWGMHTTLTRNFGSGDTQEQGKIAYKILIKEREGFQPRDSMLDCLDVCTFDCGPKGAKFRVLERFPFGE